MCNNRVCYLLLLHIYRLLLHIITYLPIVITYYYVLLPLLPVIDPKTKTGHQTVSDDLFSGEVSNRP